MLAAGRRKLGATILGCVVLLGAVVAWFALTRRRDLIGLAFDTTALQVLTPLLLLVGVAWVTLIVTTYRSLRPWRISPLTRVGGSMLVALLAATVMLPMAYAARLTDVHGDMVSTIFRSADDIRSETAPENVSAADPWGGRDRVNILLIGSDAAANRVGVRADSVILASIDTHSGDAALFSLPRNLLRVPFPAGSKLHEVYPEGFHPGRSFLSSDEELEYMLTAMYENIPNEYPDLLDSDDPGADVMKLGVGGALGLDVDYYVMVNLKGFEGMIDALGGITVNINYPVPIGGGDGIPPRDYLQPGPDQRLGGKDALWYARGRYGLSDYDRMQRQRCVIQAVIDQAEPVNVLRGYERLAEAGKELVRTDIPDQLLRPLMELALKVKDAEIESIVFDNNVIIPHQPDYDRIQRLVQKALTPPDDDADNQSGPEPADPDSSPTGEPESPDDGTGEDGDTGESDGSDDLAGAEEPDDEADTGLSVEETCAYSPRS